MAFVAFFSFKKDKRKKKKLESQRAINVMTFGISGYFIAPNEMNFNALHSNYMNCHALSISTFSK